MWTLSIALAVGIATAEVGLRTFGGAWFRGQLAATATHLRAFHRAIGDHERQRLLLKGGLATLRFSLACLGIVAVLLMVVGVAPWALRLDDPQEITFMVATSMVATLWWLIRRRQSGASGKGSDY